MAQKERRKGKAKRSGRHKAKIANYYAVRYPMNKLRRILDSEGLPAAKSWAAKHLAYGSLAKVLARRGIV